MARLQKLIESSAELKRLVESLGRARGKGQKQKAAQQVPYDTPGQTFADNSSAPAIVLGKMHALMNGVMQGMQEVVGPSLVDRHDVIDEDWAH